MSRTLALLMLATAVRTIPALAADEIHWTFTGPAAVTVDWRGADSTIRYGPTLAYGTTRVAIAPSPVPVSSPGPFREARLAGLAPATTYHYVIGVGEDHTFRTPALPGTAFTVYVEGDIGDAGAYAAMPGVQSQIAADRPDFVLVVGDLTYGDAHGPTAVDGHFDDVMGWSQDAAYLPAWGNHDWGPGSDLRDCTGRFELPHPQASPGSPDPGEDWCWFDYGSVRFLSYPEPYSGSTWSDWAARSAVLMDSAQTDPDIRFIVTFGHRPAFSSGHHPGDSRLNAILESLADTHGKYVLALSAHSHDYERTTPQHGVTFVTVGTGGSTLESESGACPWLGGCPAPSWSAARAFHHGALRLRFTATAIQGDMICAGPAQAADGDVACDPGTVLDSFVIGTTPVVRHASPLALDRIVPNPSRSLPTVVCSLASDAPAVLDLIDLAGRRLVHDELGALGPGRHEITFSSRDAPREGIYWVRLEQAGSSVSSKIVILR